MTAYDYDAVSRLTGIDNNLNGTPGDLTLGFSHNPAGQIASNTRSNDAYAWTGHYAVNRNYTANGLNRYSAIGGITPTYDSRGNLTSAGSPSFTFSPYNLLTGTSGGATLAYDPMLRLYETVGGGTTTRFAYDGMSMIAEYNSSNVLQRRFVHGPGVDEPLVWYEGTGTSTRRYFHADERGSVVAVSDSVGNVVGSVNRYDEYGVPQGGAVTGRFGFTGQAWIPEIGMYHYRARTYSPTLGRFLQTDPIGFGAGMNLYGYVLNDPVNFTDPDGLEVVYYGGSFTHRYWPRLGFNLGNFPLSSGRYPEPNFATRIGERPRERNSRRRTLICRGPVRTLEGNSDLIGETGGFGDTMPVTDRSGAIIPRQFTGEFAAGPRMREIGQRAFGFTDRGQWFIGFRDTIGNSRLGNAREAQDRIMRRDSGRLIVEIVGGADTYDMINLFIPENPFGCPDNTTQVGSF